MAVFRQLEGQYGRHSLDTRGIVCIGVQGLEDTESEHCVWKNYDLSPQWTLSPARDGDVEFKSFVSMFWQMPLVLEISSSDYLDNNLEPRLPTDCTKFWKCLEARELKCLSHFSFCMWTCLESGTSCWFVRMKIESELDLSSSLTWTWAEQCTACYAESMTVFESATWGNSISKILLQGGIL